MIGFESAAFRRGLRLGLAAGLVCGLVLAGLLWAPPARAEATQQPFAFAESGDGSRVLLYPHAGPCVGSARLAEHVTAAGERTPGCWIFLDTGVVLVSFLDGERGNIPVAKLKRPEAL